MMSRGPQGDAALAVMRDLIGRVDALNELRRRTRPDRNFSHRIADSAPASKSGAAEQRLLPGTPLA
jgi:hypothetical protein